MAPGQSKGGSALIHATDRILEVLALEPRLAAVLTEHVPALAALHQAGRDGPMSRLATVEQVARMAGVSSELLVERLNAALDGVDSTAARGHAQSFVAAELPVELAGLAADRLVDLDVRDELRRGDEPFGRIMKAVKNLDRGSALRLRVPFEPVPLYSVLGAKGLAHFSERLSDDDWRIWFWQDDNATALRSTPAPPEDDDDASNPNVTLLDVRGLEPPEPLEQTLAALDALPRGRTLVQLNERVPRFLLPELERRGFDYEIREQAPGLVRVFIRHRSPEDSDGGIDLDVRDIPPREKHPTIFRVFDQLPPGGFFTLINDHDPRPLQYQFQAERSGQFEWSYLERGPDVWRVRIAKRA